MLRLAAVILFASSTACIARSQTNGPPDSGEWAFPDAERIDLGLPPGRDGGDATIIMNRDGGFDEDAIIVPPDTGFDSGPIDYGPDTGPLNPIDPMPVPIEIGTGFGISEGPTWRTPAMRAPNNGFYFSDLGAHAVFVAQPPAWTPVQVPALTVSNNGINGMANDANGFVVFCEHGPHRLARLLDDGTIMTIADSWNGYLLNSPNDLVVASSGQIYFTDPPYSLGGRQQEMPFNAIFRVDLQGVLHDEWRGFTGTSSGTLPNGVDLSPDERTLYFAEARSGVIHAMDVNPVDGTLSRDRPFATPMGESCDGLSVDEQGNVYAGTTRGVEIFRGSDGMRWGEIPANVLGADPTCRAPRICTTPNISFGGADRRTAFVTARSHVYRYTSRIPGAR